MGYMKHVMLSRDINIWFKKNDVVEILQHDTKSKLVQVKSKKGKVCWLMEKDLW